MESDDAYRLIRKLMHQHGVGNWLLAFRPQMRRHYGRCFRLRRTIVISLPMVECNGPTSVTQVALHEIAHALTVGGHNPAWQAKAREIGWQGDEYVQAPAPSWRRRCWGCRTVTDYYARPASGIACRGCGGKTEVVEVKVGVEVGVV